MARSTPIVGKIRRFPTREDARDHAKALRAENTDPDMDYEAGRLSVEADTGSHVVEMYRRYPMHSGAKPAWYFAGYLRDGDGRG